MNLRTVLAALVAALLFPLAALAQDDPRQDTADPVPQSTQDRTGQLDDPMTTPPDPDIPPPDVDTVPLDPADRWGQLDADGDGWISAEEGRIDADFHSNFEMMDADGDGRVDPTELERAGTHERDQDDGADAGDTGDGDRQA